MSAPRWAELAHQFPHRSFFWDSVLEKAQGPALSWLVAQANARGYGGAFERTTATRETRLSDEDLAVALLRPHAEWDARVLKLLTRMLQSGRLDAATLAFRARRERADVALAWLLSVLPTSERNAQTEAVSRCLKPPRGQARVEVNYDPSRLIRRPASQRDLWRAKRGSSSRRSTGT